MGADHLADTEWAQAAVRTDVVVPITQPQFDALVSLAYNIGAGAFAKSTLVRLLSARKPRTDFISNSLRVARRSAGDAVFEHLFNVERRKRLPRDVAFDPGSIGRK